MKKRKTSKDTECELFEKTEFILTPEEIEKAEKERAAYNKMLSELGIFMDD